MVRLNSSKKTRILGIETSCDETAIALVEASGGLKAPRFKVLKEAVASQIKIHRPFGGVVPNLAKREHIKNLPILYRRVFGREQTANSKWKEIDLIAVTAGPGLEPALWAGIAFAQNLAKKHKKQLLGVNHLEGHLYSFLLPSKYNIQGLKIKTLFPAVALIVSGGHTILLLLKNFRNRVKLGETRDDAAGEAFDKVARLLKLPYPGGPELEKLAAKGDGKAVNFPRPMLHDKSYDFSFSGLKTSVLYFLRDNPEINPKDVAASFQKAAVDVLIAKTVRAAQKFKAKSILLSGGVAANKFLRKELRKVSTENGLKFIVSDPKYNTDNAVMIAAAAYMDSFAQRGRGESGLKKKYPLRANGVLGI